MIEKFNKNAEVEKFTNMLGIAVRLIVIDPLVIVCELHVVLYLSLCIFHGSTFYYIANVFLLILWLFGELHFVLYL